MIAASNKETDADVLTSVVLHSAALDEHAALVTHISAGGARRLLVGVIVLHGIAGGRDAAVAQLGLLGVAGVPDLHLLHVLAGPAGVVQGGLQVASVVAVMRKRDEKYASCTRKIYTQLAS
jgi:hypothetical protein